MPTSQLILSDSYGRVVRVDLYDSISSPRTPAGRLKLRANPFTLYKVRETSFSAVSSGLGWSPKPWDINQWGYDQSIHQKWITSCQQSARAKLLGKIHYGDASLGVTFGSWRQSLTMIASRARDIVKILQRIKSKERKREIIRDYEMIKGKSLQDIARIAANTHLEVIFGWIPLYSDMHAAMAVLADDLPPYFHSSRHRVVVKRDWNEAQFIREETLKVSATWATQVAVENYNTWLLNRLGLLNPAVVIWDLIPWSFVVNMFANVNSVLKSFTDMVGLTFSNSSVTSTIRGSRYQSYLKGWQGYNNIQECYSLQTIKSIQRSLGTPPRPSLELRVPNFDLSLLAMSGSLLTQQSRRIFKLFTQN